MSDHEMLVKLYEHFLQWNGEFGKIQANVEMLMRCFWIVLSASVGSLVASIWSLIEQKRNKK